MKPTTWAIGLVALLAGAAGRGPKPDPLAPIPKSPAYQAAYAQGKAEAESELERGRATIYIHGTLVPGEYLDEETGLPYKVIAGCEVDDEIEGRADGHNDRVWDHIKAHGLPAYSLKPWTRQLFHLASYFRTKSRLLRPLRLTVDGPSLRSPNGQYWVRAVMGSPVRGDDGGGGQPEIVVRERGVDRPAATVWWTSAKSADLFWGPHGSGFAVLRCEGEGVFLALDLRRGCWLREEYAPEPER